MKRLFDERKQVSNEDSRFGVYVKHGVYSSVLHQLAPPAELSVDFRRRQLRLSVVHLIG